MTTDISEQAGRYTLTLDAPLSEMTRAELVDEVVRLQQRNADLAALAVLGEPVAWVTADTVDGQTVNGKPRRVWWENNEGVGIPIYAAPQPAEQQPAPELYEALEELVEQSSHPDISGRVNIVRAVAALAKARGES